MRGKGSMVTPTEGGLQLFKHTRVRLLVTFLLVAALILVGNVMMYIQLSNYDRNMTKVVDEELVSLQLVESLRVYDLEAANAISGLIIDPGNSKFQRTYDSAWDKMENAMFVAGRRLTKPELVQVLEEVDDLGKSMSTTAISIAGMAGISPDLALSIFTDSYEPVGRNGRTPLKNWCAWNAVRCSAG